MIPPGRGLRIIGDVHGDSRGFTLAAQTALFVVQLGDLVDDGPDSAGVLEIMFRLIDEGRGVFLLGNHDFKLARALRGEQVTRSPALAATIGQLSPALTARTLAELARAPLWVDDGARFFVHGAFHPAMRWQPPPAFPFRRDTLAARALYGETTGRADESGRPERRLGWVDRIPAGVTVYCGHDRRSQDGRPYVRRGAAGGAAVFLDTGAGKGGHLSWIDLPAGEPLCDASSQRP
jgi:protein phosphatase